VQGIRACHCPHAMQHACVIRINQDMQPATTCGSRKTHTPLGQEWERSMCCAQHTSGPDAAACCIFTMHSCSHLKQQLQRLVAVGSSLCWQPGPAAGSVCEHEQAAAVLARLCCCLLACSALLLGCSRLLQNRADCWQLRVQDLLCMFAAGT
jgi:hypothetical protein